MSENLQVCPVCSVKILKMVGGDRVMFAAGPPGTREILWKRVCQYTQKAGCINPDGGLDGGAEGKSSFPPRST